MPLALVMALLGLRGAGRLGGGRLGGLFGARGQEPPLAPDVYGGKTFPGTGSDLYGHTIGARGTPSFNLPGAGGGSVMIPELAKAAMGGDPFARGAIERQGESAGRFRDIDLLLDIMREQAKEAGMPDPFGRGFGGPSAPAYGGPPGFD